MTSTTSPVEFILGFIFFTIGIPMILASGILLIGLLAPVLVILTGGVIVYFFMCAAFNIPVKKAIPITKTEHTE